MAISAPSGVPRPLPNGQQNPKDDKAAYQAREMEAKRVKERKAREDQIALFKRELGELKVELNAQLTTQSALQREVSQLESKNRFSGSSKKEGIVDVKNLESQYELKLSAKKAELSSLEKDNNKLEVQAQTEQRDLIDSKNELAQKNVAEERLLDQKIQTQKNNFQRITKLKDEIRLKTLELDGALEIDEKIQQEINKLTSSLEQSKTVKPEIKKTSASVLSGQALLNKISENEKRITQIKTEIKVLDQESEAKKREADATNKAVIARESQAKEQTNKENELKQKATLVANRIKYLEPQIKDLQKKISTLEAVR